MSSESFTSAGVYSNVLLKSSEIKDKDKLILAYYINTSGMNISKAKLTISSINNYVNDIFDDSVLVIVIPCDRTELVWVNKIDISDEQLEELKNRELQLDEKFNKEFSEELEKKISRHSWFSSVR